MSVDPDDGTNENTEVLNSTSLQQGQDKDIEAIESHSSSPKRWDRIREVTRTGAHDNLTRSSGESTPATTGNYARTAANLTSKQVPRSSTGVNFTPKQTPRSSTVLAFTGFSKGRNQFLGHFSRSQQLSTSSDNIHNGNGFVATTISAAHAAGMNYFGRHFGRRFNGDPGNGIYATSTSVQQDIYRLERDLRKVFNKLSTMNRHTSFSVTAADDTVTAAVGAATPEDGNTKVSQNVLSSIMETLQNHKLSDRLPLLSELLTILIMPFRTTVIRVTECNQSLDIFDYIVDRFRHFDTVESFELFLFLCRQLVVNDLDIKSRIISTIKHFLSVLARSSVTLPSAPSTFHTLVYTLTDALTHHVRQTSHLESPRDKIDHLHSDMLDILDKLSNGNIIPIAGKHWEHYTTDAGNESSIPVSVAQFCVVEGLCKTLMVGRYAQADPYKDKLNTSGKLYFESARDKLILEILLKRYWVEPSDETRPAFLLVLFVLAEVAIEKFLNGCMKDLTRPTSTVSLLWRFMQDQLPHNKVAQYFTDKKDDRLQSAVVTNIISAALAIMSITQLIEPVKIPHNQQSPNLSSQPSSEDIGIRVSSPSFIDDVFDQYEADTRQQSHLQNLLLSIKANLNGLWSAGFNKEILSNICALLEDTAGERSVTVYENLAFYLDNSNISEEIVKKSLPILFNRLTSTYPAPFPSLCRLLLKLSQQYRSIFYRPIVSCVASNEHDKVVSALVLISCLRRYMSGVQLWMHDAEMINVLLLSDIGRKHQTVGAGDGTNEIKWGTTTLGQCVIAAEFLWAVRELRHLQQHPSRNMEEDEIAKKFLIDLERRFSVFMTAKEKLLLIPMPLRVILCNLLLDLRFFCNTTHRPGWLSCVMEWATQRVGNVEYLQPFKHDQKGMSSLLGSIGSLTEATAFSPPPSSSTMPTTPTNDHQSAPIIQLEMLNDITKMFERMGLVYAATLKQLEYESSEHIEYGGERPMSMLPQSNLSVEEVHTAVFKDPLTLRSKRQLIISMVYPISRQAAASLELSPPALVKSDYHKNMTPATELSKGRLEEISKIHHDPFAAVFSLLVAVFTTLTSQEFTRLVQPVWERFMDTSRSHVFVPAAFLLLQCGEKIPKVVIQVTSHDFYSDNPHQRMEVILKHASLSAYRLNILAQDYILISSKRRPFRGDGGAFATPFVPTDLGSSRFTMDEPRWMAKLKNASNFPIELKRQIQELGWDDDDKGEEYEALRKVLTPLTLLPLLYVDEEYERIEDVDMAVTRSGEEGKSAVVNKIITRRKRAAMVPTINLAFLSMVDSLSDDYGGVHESLRELLEGHLCDDPDLFLRGFLSDLGKDDLARQYDALNRLSSLVTMQSKLPPGFTHIIFNYLAGMLKWLTRETTKHGFVLMSLIHPILTQLVLSTNELSTRDLRKNKIETLLSGTGRFWFTHEQPVSMFPRHLTNRRSSFTILEIPDDIFGVATLRVSHIQFLTNFLIRYPREVYAVKKTLQDYEAVPIGNNNSNVYTEGNNSESDAQQHNRNPLFPDIQFRRRSGRSRPLDLDYDPGDNLEHITARPRPSQEQEDTELLSLLRARVWLRFVDTLLNGLNKNYNDRKELERIFCGVNSIIINHTYDYVLIGQALILYTRAVTRFKRLFSSNHGYATFLPVLFKVFCQVERYPHIRSAITFAWCRFYAVHEESFVFQMLGALAPLILQAYTQSKVLGTWMTDNLFSLMQAMNSPPRLGATSDVLGLQLQVELDDHERSIQERIDAVSNPMTMPLSTSILKPLARSVTAPIAPLVVNNYTNRPFHLSSFIKLFLTIIAYDPGALRAEQFVKLYRHLLPLFYKMTDLVELMDEGMAALVDVFAKFSKNATPLFGTTAPESGNDSTDDNGNSASQNQHLLQEHSESNSSSSHQQQQQHAYGKHWQQNDRVTIRMEFMKLIRQYFKLGGALSEVDHEKIGYIIRSILRDHATRGKLCSTTWVKDYLDDAVQSMVGMRNYTNTLKKILQQLLSLWKSHHKVLDGSGIYQGLAIVLQKGQGKSFQLNEITALIRDRYITYGLTIVNSNGVHGFCHDRMVYDRFCKSLVMLLVTMMENSPLDIVCEMEKMVPTVSMMGMVIIPVCLQYNLQQTSHYSMADSKFKRDPTDYWVRLLVYVMKACQQASELKGKSSHGGFSFTAFTSHNNPSSNISIHIAEDRQSGVNFGHDTSDHVTEADGGDNGGKKGRFTASTASALLSTFAFIAVKIILIRGGRSLDKLKGVWSQLAHFVKGTLVFGESTSLSHKQSRSGLSSSLATPFSPMFNDGNRNSSVSINMQSPSPAIPSPSTPSGNQMFSAFILYEFTAWHFLEFVMYYKSPLVPLLRSLIEEKTLESISLSTTQVSSPFLSTPISRSSHSTSHSPRSSSYFPQQENRELSPTSRWKSWGSNTLSRQQRRRHFTRPNGGINSSENGVNGEASLPSSQGNMSSSKQQEQYQCREAQDPTASYAASQLRPVLPADGMAPTSFTTTEPTVASAFDVSVQHSNNQQKSSRPSSQQYQGSAIRQASDDRIRSLNNLQARLGIVSKNNAPVDIHTWSYVDAVRRVTGEWRLMLKLQEELAPVEVKSTHSTTPIIAANNG